MKHYRDPLEMVAYLLVDPLLMFSFFKDFTLNYTNLKNQRGADVYQDLMTSKWAKDSEAFIKEEFGETRKILPIIFYEDGVAMDNNNKRKVTPILLTIGNFSNSMQQQLSSKYIVAYYPDINLKKNKSFTQHLRRVCKFNKTRIREEIQMIHYIIHKQLWSFLFETIQQGWESGVELYALGHGCHIFHTCIPFFVGDGPS